MVKYLNATQAAQRIGISDKTIRRWLKDEKMLKKYGLQPRKKGDTYRDEYVFTESEVEYAREEYNRFRSDDQEQDLDVPGLLQRIRELEEQIPLLYTPASVDFGDINRIEHRLDEFEERLAKIEKWAYENLTRPSGVETANVATPLPEKARKPRATPASTLPEGAILASYFAEQYGVNRRTFLDQCKKGKNGVKAPVSSRPKPGREDETEYYVIPEQLEAVLQFWREQGVPFSDPGQEDQEERPTVAVATTPDLVSTSDTQESVTPVGAVEQQRKEEGGVMPLYVFTDQHNIPQKDAAAWARIHQLPRRRGIGYLLRGSMKHEIWLRFHSEPGFLPCDDCPHE